MTRFLMVHLGCYGDCIYATAVAKQIKHDHPDAHLTWAISSKYKSILELNPHVDAVWELPIQDNSQYDLYWTTMLAQISERKQKGDFDEIVLTQISGSNWTHFDGTIRSATLNGYPHPITAGVQPVLRLSDKEVQKVRDFVSPLQLERYKEVVLFECAPGSGQSYMNVDLALEITQNIVHQSPNIFFILTCPKPLPPVHPQIVDASSLSFRENAELTKYCTLLLGCSSGISWLATSDWAKPLPTVQLLNPQYNIFAGMHYDFEQWNLPRQQVLELTDCSSQNVLVCLNTLFFKDFATAKQQFHQVYRPMYFNFVWYLQHLLKFQGRTRIFKATWQFYRRNRHLSFIKMMWHALLAFVRGSRT